MSENSPPPEPTREESAPVEETASRGENRLLAILGILIAPLLTLGIGLSLFIRASLLQKTVFTSWEELGQLFVVTFLSGGFVVT
jgi:hypothetical protein